MSGWRRACDRLGITDVLEEWGPTVPTDFPTLFLLLRLTVRSPPLVIFVVCLHVSSPRSLASETILKSSLRFPRQFAPWRCNTALYVVVKCNTNGWISLDDVYH